METQTGSTDQDFWISELDLFHSDKKILNPSSTKWLTDSIVHAAQQLLKKQSKDILGLQSPQCGKTSFKPCFPNSKFLQTLHVRKNHWILASNINVQQDSASTDTVFIYDSLRATRVTNVLKTQICQLMKPQGKTVNFSIANVMEQTNLSDCGLFAIANATAIACGTDPCMCLWDVKKMRAHLLSCLESKDLSEFPHKRRKLALGGKVLKNTSIRIYCICRMPNNPSIPMVECPRCKEWYHGGCINIDVQKVIQDPKWICKNCIELVKMAKKH